VGPSPISENAGALLPGLAPSHKAGDPQEARTASPLGRTGTVVTRDSDDRRRLTAGLAGDPA